MADTAAQKMTADQFLQWCLAPEQDEARWEFVDGVPVRMMTGATRRHDQIVVNLISELRSRLRGGPCMPSTADQAVKTNAGRRVRRPDVSVDCGPYNPQGLYLRSPTVVFEVLSPSTENVTLSSKLDEYKGLAGMRHIILLDQDKLLLAHHCRAANDAWTVEELCEPHGVLKLDAISVELTLAEIYADVSFEAAGEG
jgi:Uma2 family endonuclease